MESPVPRRDQAPAAEKSDRLSAASQSLVSLLEREVLDEDLIPALIALDDVGGPVAWSMPPEGPLKTALLDYLLRGSSDRAAGEIVFLVPWDGDFASVACKVFEDRGRSRDLRLKALAGISQSSAPGLLDLLLKWASTVQEPEFAQNLATGLAIQGLRSDRKAEVVTALRAMASAHLLEPGNLSSILSSLVLLDVPEGVRALVDFVGTGPTKEIRFAAIRAMGANSGSPSTVVERADYLLDWAASADPGMRREAAFALYNLAVIGSHSRDIAGKALAVLDHSVSPSDQLLIQGMRQALEARITRLDRRP